MNLNGCGQVLLACMISIVPVAAAKQVKASGVNGRFKKTEDLFTGGHLDLLNVARFMRQNDVTTQLGILFPNAKWKEIQKLVGPDQELIESGVLDHVAFAVLREHIEKIVKSNEGYFQQLDRRIVTHPIRKTKTEAIMLGVTGGSGPYHVEIVAPVENESLANQIERNPISAHHMAIRVKNMNDAIAKVPVEFRVDKVPYTGVMDHDVAFIHPKLYGLLLELVAIHELE